MPEGWFRSTLLLVSWRAGWEMFYACYEMARTSLPEDEVREAFVGRGLVVYPWSTSIR